MKCENCIYYNYEDAAFPCSHCTEIWGAGTVSHYVEKAKPVKTVSSYPQLSIETMSDLDIVKKVKEMLEEKYGELGVAELLIQCRDRIKQLQKEGR